jgi:hypothetical protein
MLGYPKTIPAFLKNFYQFFEKIKKISVKILSPKRFGIFDTQNVWSSVSFLVSSLWDTEFLVNFSLIPLRFP